MLTDIGTLERGRIVDTVTSDGNDMALTLESFHDHQLLLRRRARKHNLSVVIEDFLQLVLGHVTQIRSVNNGSLGITKLFEMPKNNWGIIIVPRVHLFNRDVSAQSDILYGLRSLRDDTDRLSNSLGSDRVVSSKHYDLKN
jgi:hypothetical protein